APSAREHSSKKVLAAAKILSQGCDENAAPGTIARQRLRDGRQVEVEHHRRTVGRMARGQSGLAGTAGSWHPAGGLGPGLDRGARGGPAAARGGRRGRRPPGGMGPGPVGGPAPAARGGPDRVCHRLDPGSGAVPGFGSGLHLVEPFALRAVRPGPDGRPPRNRQLTAAEGTTLRGRWIRRMVHGPGTVPVTQLAFWLVAPRPHGPQPRTPLYTPTFRQCKILTIQDRKSVVKGKNVISVG